MQNFGGTMAGLASVQARATVVSLKARSERLKAIECDHDERLSGTQVDLGCLPKLLGYNLRRANQSSWRAYVSSIGEQNIRPGLFSLLVLVQNNPGIAQIELGTHLGVDKASIVALLDRLEFSELIARKRSTRDRRRQGIFLTDTGKQALETLLTDVRVLEKQLAGRYTKPELDQFIGYLQRMYR
jgi:DNA-binding MarR family transcriptional regulator